ncbi:hypothetical protein MBANPS3_012530 [Mucor bainieri]
MVGALMLHKIELYKMNLTARGRYNYRRLHDTNLATTPDDNAFINETIEDSLPTNEDKTHDLILPDYASFIKPTVYMTNIENDDDKSIP